ALAAAARWAALPRDPLVSTLFWCWTAGIAVVLLFRSNLDAAAPTVSGEIHRAGGAVLFASLPLAAWTLSARLRTEPAWRTAARALRRGAVAGVVTAAAFGMAQVVTWLPGGLFERAALLAEFSIVVTTAMALRRAAARAAEARRVQPPAARAQTGTETPAADTRQAAR
ncbi:DUF998 domain-containing protein, partial [Amycolatopsis vancoresmycina]